MAPAPSPSSLAPDLDRSWEWGAKREMGVRGRASGNREGQVAIGKGGGGV